MKLEKRTQIPKKPSMTKLPLNILLILVMFLAIACEKAPPPTFKVSNNVNTLKGSKPKFRFIKEMPKKLQIEDGTVCLREAINYSSFKYGIFVGCGTFDAQNGKAYLIDIEKKKVIQSFNIFTKFYSNVLNNFLFVGDVRLEQNTVQDLKIIDLSTAKEVFKVPRGTLEDIRIFPTSKNNFLISMESTDHVQETTKIVYHKIDSDIFTPNFSSFEVPYRSQLWGAVDNIMLFVNGGRSKVFSVDAFTGKGLVDVTPAAQSPAFLNPIWQMYSLDRFFIDEYLHLDEDKWRVFDFLKHSHCDISASEAKVSYLKVSNNEDFHKSRLARTSDQKLQFFDFYAKERLPNTPLKHYSKVFNMETCTEVFPDLVATNRPAFGIGGREFLTNGFYFSISNEGRLIKIVDLIEGAITDSLPLQNGSQVLFFVDTRLLQISTVDENIQLYSF